MYNYKRKKLAGLCSLIFILSSLNTTQSSAISLDEEHNFYSSIKGVLETSKSSSELKENLKPILQEIFNLKIKDYMSSIDSGEENTEKIKNSVLECLNFYDKNTMLRTHHFGYPANMCERSELVNIFKYIEKSGFLANNCGDVNETGNYQMDSKKIERDILELFAKKFGIEDNYWGYVTSGGSESNQWAINTAFQKHPDGILYFCESAHYSIYKNSEHYKRRIISQNSNDDESINCDALFKQIMKDYSETKSPANIILTWGTTKYGSCDDIKKITDFLISKNIPYYVHVDAALFGGIPNNQLDAPVIKDIKNLNIDSICASLHKYIGVPTVKSVLLSTQHAFGKHIDYIGQTDSTTCGSRDIMPFSTKQQIIDILYHSEPNDYIKNINFFIECLNKQRISFIRNKNSNIFVIDAPNDDVCKKYQLSCFSDKSGVKKAHIIIFPYQNQEVIKELVNDLKDCQGE